MIEETLKLALEYVNLKSLPKEHEGAYRTRSVCLVRKSIGIEVYCIGAYDEKEEKTSVIKDF